METSDHVPCVITINTVVPKGKIFRFENFWMEHPQFLSVVQHGWNVPTNQTDIAKVVVLKAWRATVSNLSQAISNIKPIIEFFDILEEFRDMAIL